MNELRRRWLSAHYAVRSFTWLAFIGGGGLLTFWLWIQPQRELGQQLRQEAHQLAQAYRIRFEALRQPPLLHDVLTENTRLRMLLSERSNRFSLTVLLAQSGGELAHWRPDAAGGMLGLRLSWAQLIRVFSYLHGVRPLPDYPHFTIQRSGNQLLAQFTLRLTDEE
ncbi:pilus assembly protein HofO [Paramixta manurensis]|uniref:Pilus assembly protein HofO n=1 Tax=Paramixta manurensis TaxID=2740817 RepID=A0A6M8UIG7_9GAMM|nr:pilus assembly protein HofO [Erwiniaceae bacterium PD-1]